MSDQTRRKHTPEFKFKVALESLQTGEFTEVARKYGLAYSLVKKWAQQFEKEGHNIFLTTPDKEKERMKKQIGKLEQMIGKKEVELNLLKNFSDFYESQNTE